MKTYSLTTLLDLRKQKDDKAQIYLREAIDHYQREQQKFYEIEALLQKTRSEISKINQNFFDEAFCLNQSSKEYLCFSFFAQKKNNEEEKLKKLLSFQREKLSEAIFNYNNALKYALTAKQNLKIIEKHHENWQKQEKRLHEIKIDYENDDQNNLRFFMNSKA